MQYTTPNQVLESLRDAGIDAIYKPDLGVIQTPHTTIRPRYGVAGVSVQHAHGGATFTGWQVSSHMLRYVAEYEAWLSEPHIVRTWQMPAWVVQAAVGAFVALGALLGGVLR